MKKIIFIIGVLFILIQFVPYGREHTNPKIVAEPNWDSNETKIIFFKACADCHSNETKWPWYSNVAPISWIISNHIEEGREHFNVSNWGFQKKNKGKDAAEEVEEENMPMKPYLLLHSEANLSNSEKENLIKGLKNTFGEDKD
jgi:mono/diheme cytochrome c family protein